MTVLKTVIILLFFIVSCSKKDSINHYLNEKVSEQELIENGFYKYSYTYNEKKLDEIDYTYNYESYFESKIYSKKEVLSETKFKDSLKKFGKIYKFELYSNVKPHKKENGKLCPTSLFKAYDDKVQEKERINFLVNEIENRVISYRFFNDVLTYKSIYVYEVDKSKKHIPDFSTQKKIKHYYDSLKIPIVPILEGTRSTKKYTTLFYINKYKTSIEYSKHTKPSYNILTNYYNNETDLGYLFERWYDNGGYEFESTK
ncbi:hypothetical protein ABF176_002449 [Flavobacterium psychrophilum]